MAYAQVSDILARVHALRERVCRYCERQRDGTDDDLVRAVMERVTRHEQAMEACLAKYTSDAARGILDTWIQYPGLEPLDEAIEETASATDQSAADVLDRLLACERLLLGVYQDMADQASGPRVQEFLQNILFMESQQGRAVGREVTDIGDLRSL